MSSQNVGKHSSVAGYAGDASPGTVTDGGATSSLIIEGESSKSQCEAPKMTSVEAAELVSADQPTSAYLTSPPPKRRLQDTSNTDSISFGIRIGDDFEERLAKDNPDLEYDLMPVAEVAAMLSTPAILQPLLEEAIAENSSSAVDAHFGAAGDELTGRWAESALDHGHLPPAFEEDWSHDTPDHEDEQVDEKRAGGSSQKSGRKPSATTGDIQEKGDIVGALDAAAAPEADDSEEALLPVAVQLARKAYKAIKPRLDRIAEEGLPSWPHNPTLDVVEAVNPLPEEGIPEAPQVNMRRMTRSSQVQSELPLKEPLTRSPLAPESPELELLAPKERKTQSGGVKKTSRRPTILQPRSDPVTHAAPSSLSRAPGVTLKAPRPPKVSGTAKRANRIPVADHVLPMAPVQEAQPASPHTSATSRTPQLPEAKGAATTVRRPKNSQAHSSRTVGSGVAGPSTSASVGQPLYPPALAQRIWDLAEAGKYHAALSLFDPQERFRRITGEAEVQEYLHEHPEAGEKLRPLTSGGPRKDLFLCGLRTFWVPTEGKKEGSRDFVLEHRTMDCPVGYATQDNLYKHVYKFHLKKEYGQYPRNGSSRKEPKKPAKGKASQNQGKSRASKKDADDYEDEVDDE